MLTRNSPPCKCKFPCVYDISKSCGLEQEAVGKYKFDFDDNLDTSGISEEVLAMRSYEV